MTDPTNIDHPGYWSNRYRTGRAGWDLGTPTPVFGEPLRTAHFRPGRLLLPGCGSGHDAVAFVRAGFTVTGVDLDEVERLLLPSFRLLSREMHPATIAPRRGREVLTVWERTT